MPRTNPSAPTSNPDASVLDATENHAPASVIMRSDGTPLNDPGSYVRDVKTKASFYDLFAGDTWLYQCPMRTAGSMDDG